MADGKDTLVTEAQRWWATHKDADITTGDRMIQGVHFSRQQYEVVMQAISAALLWGEDASEACAVRIQSDYHDHNQIGASMTVFMGAGMSAEMSSAAVDLLYRAHYEKSWRGTGIEGPQGTWRFDLRDGE